MKNIRKLYSAIILVGIVAGILPSGLHAQRGPQDTWYLDKEVPLPSMPGLISPYGLDFAPNGDAYVVDNGNDRVSVWDANGSFLRGWGKEGTGNGQFKNPLGIAVAAGEVFVTDYDNNRVQVFDLQGNFLRKWGSSGTIDGQMKKPWGVTVDVVDANLTEVYVAEHDNHRIQVFDSNGAYRRKFGSATLNQRPVEVKIGPDGLVYVSSKDKSRIKVFQKNGTYLRELNPLNRPYAIDFLGNRLAVVCEHHRVRIFETDGTLVTTIGSGSASSNAGLFNYNYGLAADPSGNLHVSCRDNHRIQVFDANGTYKRTYGFNDTAGMDPIDIVHTPENTFIVSEVSGDRIFETDENGTMLRFLATKGSEQGFVNNPYAMDLGPDGRLYVSDGANDRIQVFERNGTLARTIGSVGTGNGNLDEPRGIAVSQAGDVYVADRNNHRIQVFDSNGTFLRKWGSIGTGDGQLNAPIGLDLDDDGSVVVADYDNNRAVVFDANGQFLRKWSISSKAYQVANLNNGLLFFGGGGSSTTTTTYVKLYEKDGTLVKGWNPGSGGQSPIVSLPDGTLVLAHRGKDTLQFYRPTYRTIRPGQSKEIPLPEVISVAQRPDTNYLDLTYRINDADSPNVKAALLAFVDGGTSLSKVIVPKTFVGDVSGKLDDNVSTGQNHTVTWNAGEDWDVKLGELEVAVLARDDRDLLNLHFLTLPATDANSTQLKISRSPVTDGDLLKLWYWLIASGHTGSKFEHGMVWANDANTSYPFPSDVAGLKLRLDANDVDGDGQPDQLSEGAEVTTWTDKAGGDHNATGGNPPTYAASGLNGKPSLHFDGTTDWLAFPAINDVRTVFWVVTPTSTDQNRHYFLSHSSSSDFHSHDAYFWRSNASNAVKNGDTYLNGAHILGTQTNVPIGDPFILSVVTTGNVNASQLGRDKTSHVRSWQGEMSEILIYSAALSSADRSRVETYLAVKWGLGLDQTSIPDVFASGSSTTSDGRAYLLDMMNLREATAQEVARAKEGATPGVINQFTPTFKVGPGQRPVKVNEYGFDTGATSGFWVVPK